MCEMTFEEFQGDSCLVVPITYKEIVLLCDTIFTHFLTESPYHEDLDWYLHVVIEKVVNKFWFEKDHVRDKIISLIKEKLKQVETGELSNPDFLSDIVQMMMKLNQNSLKFQA